MYIYYRAFLQAKRGKVSGRLSFWYCSAECTDILYLKQSILNGAYRLVCILLIWFCQGSKLKAKFSKKSEIPLSEGSPPTPRPRGWCF